MPPSTLPAAPTAAPAICEFDCSATVYLYLNIYTTARARARETHLRRVTERLRRELARVLAVAARAVRVCTPRARHCRARTSLPVPVPVPVPVPLALALALPLPLPLARALTAPCDELPRPSPH